MNISPVYAHLVKPSKLPFKVSKSVTSKPLETFGTDAKNSCPRDSFFWNQWTLDFSGWQFISQQKLENLSVWKKAQVLWTQSFEQILLEAKKIIENSWKWADNISLPTFLFCQHEMWCPSALFGGYSVTGAPNLVTRNWEFSFLHCSHILDMWLFRHGHWLQAHYQKDALIIISTPSTFHTRSHYHFHWFHLLWVPSASFC